VKLSIVRLWRRLSGTLRPFRQKPIRNFHYQAIDKSAADLIFVEVQCHARDQPAVGEFATGKRSGSLAH